MVFLWKNNIYRDFVVSFIIFISPFLFFIYKIVPKNVYRWETNLFEIELKSINFELQDVFWYLNYKLLFIVLFSIWYLTCKHSWRYVILIPIIIEFHKLIGFLFDITDSFSQYRIFYSLLISLPIVLLLTYLSSKLNYYSYSKNINQKLDSEIDDLIYNVSSFNKKKYRNLKIQLVILRQEKNHLSKLEYLTKLIKLREEYSAQEV